MNQNGQLLQAVKLLLVFALKMGLWVLLMISMPILFGLVLILGVIWKTMTPQLARRY